MDAIGRGRQAKIFLPTMKSFGGLSLRSLFALRALFFKKILSRGEGGERRENEKIWWEPICTWAALALPNSSNFW
jgi:hypothetical protein